MCNIAGYVGTRDAAPILIEMLKREEGFAGGFYSGIATIHEGKIYYAKLTGDIDRLLALTEAAKLPGKIGIIHTRSKSGGGDEWSHPFVSQACGAGEIDCAYVANGSAGIFQSMIDKSIRKAEQLIAQGYVMRSRDRFETDYPTLSDGSCVHMSDLMCANIQHNVDLGMTPPRAMEEAFCELPGEIVGLLLHRATPDEIHWSRINMPMFLGFAPHGAYLATSALAFPSDADEEILLPAQFSGSVSKDRYTAIPYRVPTEKRLGKNNLTITAGAYTIIRDLLAQGEQHFGDVYKAITPLYKDCDYTDSEPLAYHILQALAKEGVLEIHTARVPGVNDGLTAPRATFSLKKG